MEGSPVVEKKENVEVIDRNIEAQKRVLEMFRNVTVKEVMDHGVEIGR